MDGDSWCRLRPGDLREMRAIGVRRHPSEGVPRLKQIHLPCAASCFTALGVRYHGGPSRPDRPVDEGVAGAERKDYLVSVVEPDTATIGDQYKVLWRNRVALDSNVFAQVASQRAISGVRTTGSSPMISNGASNHATETGRWDRWSAKVSLARCMNWMCSFWCGTISRFWISSGLILSWLTSFIP